MSRDARDYVFAEIGKGRWTPSQQVLMLVIADTVNGGDRFYAGSGDLGRRTGRDPGNVRHDLAALVADGALERVGRTYVLTRTERVHPTRREKRVDTTRDPRASHAASASIPRGKRVHPTHITEVTEVTETATPQHVEAVASPLPVPETSSDNPSSLDRRRGKRLPDDWPLTDELRRVALQGDPAASDAWIEHVHAGFLDYWHGVPGARGTKLDWPATFRNRMRAQARFRPASMTRSSMSTIDLPVMTPEEYEAFCAAAANELESSHA